MKNKKGSKNIEIYFIAMFAIVLAAAGFIIAETSEPEIELNDLVSNLEGSGYGWLVDYNVKNGGIF